MAKVKAKKTVITPRVTPAGISFIKGLGEKRPDTTSNRGTPRLKKSSMTEAIARRLGYDRVNVPAEKKEANPARGTSSPKGKEVIPPPKTPRHRRPVPKGGGTAISKNLLGGTQEHPYWGRDYEGLLRETRPLGNKSSISKEVIHRRVRGEEGPKSGSTVYKEIPDDFDPRAEEPLDNDEDGYGRTSPKKKPPKRVK